MENITTATEQNAQAENMGNVAQGTETSKKTFTQEEVNGFVQSRVTRMKSQIEKDVKAEYEQKMADLDAREMKLLVLEHLAERGMDKELANIITCKDEEDLKTKLDTLQKYTSKKDDSRPEQGFRNVGAAPNPNGNNTDLTRKAFGLR